MEKASWLTSTGTPSYQICSSELYRASDFAGRIGSTKEANPNELSRSVTCVFGLVHEEDLSILAREPRLKCRVLHVNGPSDYVETDKKPQQRHRMNSAMVPVHEANRG